MISLFPKFQLSSKIDIDSQNIFSVQIIANLMLFARNQMQHSQMGQKLRNILFEPYLSQTFNNYEKKIQDATNHGTSLGIIVDHLLSATNLLQSELSNKKKKSIKEMSSVDLKKVLYFL